MKFLLKTLSAALIALPLVPATVDAAPKHHHAQRGAVAPPHVDGFDVEQVKQLTPGTDLNFKLYGTPGAVATLALAGSARRLPLEETQLGVYEGTYTVSTRDMFRPWARSARLRPPLWLAPIWSPERGPARRPASPRERYVPKAHKRVANSCSTFYDALQNRDRWCHSKQS